MFNLKENITWAPTHYRVLRSKCLNLTYPQMIPTECPSTWLTTSKATQSMSHRDSSIFRSHLSLKWIIYNFFFILPALSIHELQDSHSLLACALPMLHGSHRSVIRGAASSRAPPSLTRGQNTKHTPLRTPTSFRPVQGGHPRQAVGLQRILETTATQHTCQKKETRKATLALSHILNWLPGAFPTLFTKDCVCFLSV